MMKKRPILAPGLPCPRQKNARLGMNEYELSKNEQLDEYKVKDLNVDAKFPFKDNSFDVVTCVVSVSLSLRTRTGRELTLYFCPSVG